MVNRVDPLEIQSVLEYYFIGSYRHIKELSPGYANRSFRLDTDEGSFLYRKILGKGYEDLSQEIAILNDLRSVNYPAAFPVQRSDGTYISSTPNGMVVIYDFLEGDTPLQSLAVCQSVGGAVGSLNCFEPSIPFHRKNSICLESTIAFSDSLSDAPPQYPDIYEYFREETDYLSGQVECGLPEGLIHADVFPDNTIFEGDKLIGLIDFEEACWDELLFDLAMTINGFCFPENTLSTPHLKAVISGYTQQRRLTEEEHDKLPIYIQWTAHGMLGWHLARLRKNPNARQEGRVRQLMARVKMLRGVD